MVPCPRLSDLPPPPPGHTGWPWTEGSPSLPRSLPGGKPWSRISIVTPSYNQGQFLEETIRSVLLQGYPDLEYLIIDGGSTDDSVDIIRKYEPWLAHWVSEPDQGQSEAINKGFGKTTGEIVAWLNSDDVYQPGVLGQTAAYLTRHPETDLVYSDFELIDERGQRTRTVSVPPFDPETLVLGNYIPQPTVFFRRNLLERLGSLELSLHYVMDYQYWLRALIHGFRIERVSGCAASFRQHGAAKTTAQEPQVWIEFARVFEDLYGQPQLPVRLGRLKRRVYARLHWNTAVSFQGVGLLPEARCHSALAVDTFDVARTREDLHFALDRVVRLPDRRLLTPAELHTRLSDLSSSSEAYSRLRKEVYARYDQLLLEQAYQQGSAKDLLLSACRVARTSPRWLVRSGTRFVARTMVGRRAAS